MSLHTPTGEDNLFRLSSAIVATSLFRAHALYCHDSRCSCYNQCPSCFDNTTTFALLLSRSSRDVFILLPSRRRSSHCYDDDGHCNTSVSTAASPCRSYCPCCPATGHCCCRHCFCCYNYDIDDMSVLFTLTPAFVASCSYKLCWTRRLRSSASRASKRVVVHQPTTIPVPKLPVPPALPPPTTTQDKQHGYFCV